MIELSAREFRQRLKTEDMSGVMVKEIIDFDAFPVHMGGLRAIRNCVFSDFRFPNQHHHTLLFEDCTFNKLTISHFQGQEVRIEKSTIESLKLEDGLRLSVLIITDCKHIGEIVFHNPTVPEVRILGSNFENLKILGIREGSNLKVEGVYQTAKAISIKTDVSLDIEDLNVESVSVTTRGGNVRLHNVNSTDCSFNSGGVVVIQGGSFEKIESTGALHRFEIGKIKEEGPVYVGTLSLNGSSKVLALNLTDCSFNKLDLSNTQFERCEFDRVKVEGELRMESTVVANGTLLNSDFSKSSIRYKTATLSNTTLVNVRWPAGYKFYEYDVERTLMPPSEQLDFLWGLKENYRQMKVLSLDQHNKIDALYFQKQELNIFWLITKLRTRHESFFSNIGNWFILGTNKVFSDFGQNIWRPLIWLFGTHLVWYALILYFNFRIYPTIDPRKELTLECLNSYFITILPTHSSVLSLGGLENVPIGGFVDFLMRISSGYFIFYFVHSSRKYHH